MYDVILISTHYNYHTDGSILPSQDHEEHDDLSYIIPLGIVSIAQYLHNQGFNVRVVHIPHEMHLLRRFGINEYQIGNTVEKILINYPAHVCGIQLHWYLYCGGAVYIANTYKHLFPDSKIFLGGYMATSLWKELLTFSKDIDGIVLGEGEKSFEKITVESLASKDCDLRNVGGIAMRSGQDNYIYNPPCEESVLPLDEMPIIHPDSPPFENIIWQKRYSINISRGICPEICPYCVANNKSINSRTYQTLKIEKIIEQLHVYQRFGIKDLFLGENHFLNRSFMTELVEHITQENFAIYFELETHPIIFETDDLLEKMIEAKFLRFTMGCESGSDSLLKRIGRNANSKQIIDNVKRIVERGGIVLTSWISNLPGETDSEFQETQESMHQVVNSGGFIYWIENLHVLPGSKLYNNPKKWNIEILVDTLDKWIRWSILSKQYVTYEMANREPTKYLTHLNNNTSPQKMIKHFYSNRKLALSLIPEMKLNLENRLKNLPSDILETEKQVLDWYERKGWKLWLF